MGYIYKLEKYYKIKEKKKVYDWPCSLDENRKITIFDDDILTIDSEGDDICNVTKHTGLCCLNILIPKDDMIECNKTIKLKVN